MLKYIMQSTDYFINNSINHVKNQEEFFNDTFNINEIIDDKINMLQNYAVIPHAHDEYYPIKNFLKSWLFSYK